MLRSPNWRSWKQKPRLRVLLTLKATKCNTSHEETFQQLTHCSKEWNLSLLNGTSWFVSRTRAPRVGQPLRNTSRMNSPTIQRTRKTPFSREKSARQDQGEESPFVGVSSNRHISALAADRGHWANSSVCPSRFRRTVPAVPNSKNASWRELPSRFPETTARWVLLNWFSQMFRRFWSSWS